MSATQAEPAFEIVDESYPWECMRPQGPPPRKPPPEDYDDGWRFDGDDAPQRSRLNNAHLGILMLLISETMLFAVLMAAFLVFRVERAIWPPPALSQVPFWVTACSTLMLLSSALTMWQA